jgi:hydroxyacylglutathione hydrolase
MKIHTVVVGPVEVNCLIVTGNEKDALVIDPGSDPEQIIALLKKENLSVAGYALTHGHTDHVSALAQMYEAMPAPIAMHEADLSWAFEEINQLPPLYPPPARPSKIERILQDGDEINAAGLRYEVIHTPGHTPGGICLYIPDEKILFSGDTLFAGSVGRTDLPGGDSRILHSSLERIAQLPDDTAIFPGHGPATAMEREKQVNFFLQALASNR